MEDIIPDTAFDAPPIVSLSESPLHAFEVHENQFVAGRREKFRVALRDVLHEGKLVDWPFVGLEVARFVDDPLEEEAYAVRCAGSLMSQSTRLASLWLSGSSLSEKVRAAANNVIHRGEVLAPSWAGNKNADAKKSSVGNESEASETPAGLDWLRSADINHESWARVWRQIWSSARHSLSTREVHALRGIEWLDQVNPNHSGWASVWFRIWEEAEPSVRSDLLQKALGWLRDTDPKHLRWPFIWVTLWDCKQFSSRHESLSVLGTEWVSTPDIAIPDWTGVWLRLWDFYSSDKDRRDSLRENAFEWLYRTNSYRKEWSIVWQVLFAAASDDDFAEFTDCKRDS